MSVMRSIVLLSFLAIFLQAQNLPLVDAQDVGFDPQRLSQVDNVIAKAIQDNEIPGAVLMVLKDDKIAYQKAYGQRQLIPKKLPMTVETVFDMASLTKPVATSTAMMILVERGQIRLLDKVKHYFPGYMPWVDAETKKKTDIRLIHLLTHTSGLPAYAHPNLLMKKYGSASPDTLYRHIEIVERFAMPGKAFKYSGLNYMTMQRIIEQVTGMPLNRFVQKEVFQPLQMEKTAYLVKEALLENCAATEVLDGKPLIGIVHDPKARIVMKGISANAGMFSTAYDMAVYASMLLNDGAWNGVRVLSPAGVKAFTQVPKGFEKFGRALGWDLNSDYASNQGDLLSDATFGHTGYTGTSMVVDPQKKLAIIFLTNRVHPDDKGKVVRLRSLVSNTVAASIVR